VLLAVSPVALNQFVIALTREELSEDPHDFIAVHLLQTTHGLHGSATVFGAIYLLTHGMAKIVLVAALIKNKLWAYPWMIAFLLAFICYQLYRVAIGPTLAITGLTIFDVTIVWLTYREYHKELATRRVRSGSAA
jgi:uncharacterized membrane protein